jgi:hypothetical protein
MAKLTRFQAIREALIELGTSASNDEIGRYVAQEHGYEFPDAGALALFISMVNSKMTRTGLYSKMPSSRRKR